jgi:hypothetical protein
MLNNMSVEVKALLFTISILGIFAIFMAVFMWQPFLISVIISVISLVGFVYIFNHA